MKHNSAVRIIVFALIFCVLFCGVNRVLMTVDKMGYQNIRGFYEEPENSLDAVYIGSSNCFVFWNSLAAWKNFGIAVYPYACNSNLFFSTEYLIREARKTQPDAMFIVNINSLNDGSVNLQEMRNLTDAMPFSWNKLHLINYMSDVGDYSLHDRLEFYLPILRYHTRWSELKASDFQPTELSGLKGASTYNPYLTRQQDLTKSYVTTDVSAAELSEKIVSSTEQLLDYCDDEQVQVLFITVPQSKNISAVERYNALNDLIERRGYPVLNLMDRTDDMGLLLETDFYNEAHTNVHGSLKFTYYLSEYLVDQFGLTDKREDPAYADWNAAVETYFYKVSDFVLDVETTPDVYDKTLEAPTVTAQKKDGYVEIAWTPVEGADGYLVYRKLNEYWGWKLMLDTDALEWHDKMNEEYNKYYTVVPYSSGDTTYRGNFNYSGVTIQ